MAVAACAAEIVDAGAAEAELLVVGIVAEEGDDEGGSASPAPREVRAWTDEETKLDAVRGWLAGDEGLESCVPSSAVSLSWRARIALSTRAVRASPA